MKLQARRRRLVNELQRTEQRLRDAAQASDNSEFGDTYTESHVMPGGGGGAPRRQKTTPSAGGPFAGKKTNYGRTVADDEFKSLNRSAGDAFRYLGPGSDG